MGNTLAERSLDENTKKAMAYLKAQGLESNELSASSVQMNEVHETEYTGTGESQVARAIQCAFPIGD